MIIILVNILLHICFITFSQGKSNSKYANTLKTVMGLVAVAVRPKIKNSLFGIADRLTCFAATQKFFPKSEIFFLSFPSMCK